MSPGNWVRSEHTWKNRPRIWEGLDSQHHGSSYMSQLDAVRNEGLYVCVKGEESKYLARAVTDPETSTPGKLPTLAL